ncbi:MAG: hypothetical protein ACO3L6_01175 [Dehalococcoidia bacterium]
MKLDLYVDEGTGFSFRATYTHTMISWAKRPGEKVIITRRALEDLIFHLENAETYSKRQFVEDAKQLRDQLNHSANRRRS